MSLQRIAFLQAAVSAVFALAADISSTVVDIPIYGIDTSDGGLVASVVAVGSDATTMKLCIASATDCGFPSHNTLVYGSSSYNMLYSDYEWTMTQQCTFNAAQTATARPSEIAAVCAESAGGTSANFPGSSTTDYDDFTIIPVTITGGLGLLVAPGPTATASTASTTPAGTGAHTTQVTATTGSGSNAKTAASTGGSQTTSTAGAASTGSAARGYAPVGGMGLMLGAAACFLGA